MTLYINVLSTEKLLQGGILIVEGSKAGNLACQNIHPDTKLNQPFKIKCASDDTLEFILVRNLKQYQTNKIVSRGTIHAQSLTKRFRNQLMGYHLGNYVPGQSTIRDSELRLTNRNNDQNLRSSVSGLRTSHQANLFIYDVQMYTPQEKYAGLIHTSLSYDPVSHFEGQFCSADRHKKGTRKKVCLFKGKCPTKNLFSILDPSCDNQTSKFIQSIYKDGDVQYIDE